MTAPPTPPAARPPSRGWRSGTTTVAQEGAGFVLALLFWGWVALPLVRGGPDEVRRLWKAKWLNKAPDGSWLP